MDNGMRLQPAVQQAETRRGQSQWHRHGFWVFYHDRKSNRSPQVVHNKQAKNVHVGCGQIGGTTDGEIHGEQRSGVQKPIHTAWHNRCHDSSGGLRIAAVFSLLSAEMQDGKDQGCQSKQKTTDGGMSRAFVKPHNVPRRRVCMFERFCVPHWLYL